MNKLYGLVLVGGKSRRMKQDKAKLVYHDGPQYVHCTKLLEKYCVRTFLSLRVDQADEYSSEGINHLYDKEAYAGRGPLGGIISAIETEREVDWLVVACDLPYLNEETIETLISARGKEMVVAFESAKDRLPEPLCAIYSKDFVGVLKSAFFEGLNCPRKILINENISLLKQVNSHALDNINNKEEYHKYKESLC